MLSNRNLLNIIDDQKQKQDFAIHITRQSDDFDVYKFNNVGWSKYEIYNNKH